MQLYQHLNQRLEIKLAVETPKEATPLHPPLPVSAAIRVSFRLLSLSLLRPVYTKDSRRDQIFAAKVAAV